MNKKALVLVSFGTAVPQAAQATKQMEQALCAADKDFDFYRAYTSKVVIAKLQRESGIAVSTPLELIGSLHHQGYEQVLCQSLHIVKGEEYSKLLAELQGCSSLFPILSLGEPLLSAPEDFAACVQALMEDTPSEQNEALVLMGHGGQHAGNVAYHTLQQAFCHLGHSKVFVGTVEGTCGLEEVLQKLHEARLHKACLRPFLLVAGEHARNDMAGEQEGSWKSLLEADGIQTRSILHGLGELPTITEIFRRHIQNAKRL